MVQNVVYEVGKAHGFEPLRAWFAALYEVLFGQTAGPRFGSFAALFGCAETAALIRRALERRISEMRMLAAVLLAAGAGALPPAATQPMLFTRFMPAADYEDAMQAGEDATGRRASPSPPAPRWRMRCCGPRPACLPAAGGRFRPRAPWRPIRDRADGHVWLAARWAMRRASPADQARLAQHARARRRMQLDAALRTIPTIPMRWRRWAAGISRSCAPAAPFWRGKLYGASLDGLALFDRAVKCGAGQCGGALPDRAVAGGLDAANFAPASKTSWPRRARDAPETAYEKFIQVRAGELLNLMKRGDNDAFDAKLKTFQGYPS